ncbi:hypothetical protein Ddc_10553 [Ditylenchus destructor]|nr:hypothetical protein Ddc_10553 [Ditylenchus destructor]
MPPPSPPKDSLPTHSISLSRQMDDDLDDGGEKFDELYEEIEQAFKEERQRKLSQETTSFPLHSLHYGESQTLERTGKSDTYAQNNEEKYVPKYRKKIYGRFSPPDFYRSSMAKPTSPNPNALKPKNHDYDSLSIYAAEVASIASRDHHHYSSSHIYASGDKPYAAATNLAQNDSGYNLVEHSFAGQNRDLRHESYSDDDDLMSSNDPHNQSYSDYLPGSTATFTPPRLKWRHCGRYDTWSASAHPEQAAMVRSVAEESRTLSGDYPHSARGHSIRGGSVSRAKSSYQHKRKSLSELWRFKSELQLNFTKKMDQIRSKVNGTISGRHSVAFHSHASNNPGARTSMFYVQSQKCAECEKSGSQFCFCHRDSNSRPGDHLDYFGEDETNENLDNRQVPPEDDDECIYGDDWSSSDEEEDSRARNGWFLV